MSETRNAWGYPVINPDKQQAAQQYAAEVRERNKPQCSCNLCMQQEKLPAVQMLLSKVKL